MASRQVFLADLFGDAFRPIALDGASNLEVMLRLQKAVVAIANAGTGEARTLAIAHSRQAYERAALAIVKPNRILIDNINNINTKAHESYSASQVTNRHQ